MERALDAARTTKHPAVERTSVLPFAAIYESHARFVWRVLYRLGVARADVEDVCQEVFLVVHRRLAEFEGRSSLRTWIYGIALRCASDYRRRTARHQTSGEPPHDLAIDAAQLEHVDAREARALLDRMLDLLDADKREVFVLFELEELSMAEVIAIVGCPLQTGYSRLHAARAVLTAAASRIQAEERRS
jgi:RNA polymerase sigma-70 factor (ECF subfamily)